MNRAVAVLIGAGIAGGIVLLLRRAAQPSSTGTSACEKAAALAEKAKPGSGAAILAGCALLNSEAGKAITGTVAGALDGLGSLVGIGGEKNCPEGTIKATDNRGPTSTSGIPLTGALRFSACVPIPEGTGFLPPPPVAPPPTAGSLATSTPTGTSRDGRWSGGVSVT